jgi:hypothetical protein
VPGGHPPAVVTGPSVGGGGSGPGEGPETEGALFDGALSRAWGAGGGHPPAVIGSRRRSGHYATALRTRQSTVGPCPPPPFGGRDKTDQSPEMPVLFPPLGRPATWGVPGGHPPAVIRGRRRSGHYATALRTRRSSVGPCPPPPFGVLPPSEGETEPVAGSVSRACCSLPSGDPPPGGCRGVIPLQSSEAGDGGGTVRRCSTAAGGS